MPSVHPPAQVLITGVSGFIGSWTTRAFLERGYNVRGTVRSKNKGEWLCDQEWMKAAPGKFEYHIVKDLEAPGALDEAVKGVDVVVHTASPATLAPTGDPHATVIDPAVNGTMAVLNSVLKNGLTVKRLEVTSSIAAIEEPTKTLRVFTEDDWNTFSLKEIENGGSDPIHCYRASKTEAEHAVWDFVEHNKGKLNFDVTTILPASVFGPFIHDVHSIDELNVSLKIFYDNVNREGPGPVDIPIGDEGFVDVRDVAAMHVEAIETDKAAGQRFIANAGSCTLQDVYDALNSHVDPFEGVPVGIPGAGKTVFHPSIFDNEKSRAVLGFKYRPLGEVCYDTVSSFEEHGFW